MDAATFWFIRHRAELEYSRADSWFRQMLANPHAGQRLVWAAHDLIRAARALRMQGMHASPGLLRKAEEITRQPPPRPRQRKP